MEEAVERMVQEEPLGDEDSPLSAPAEATDEHVLLRNRSGLKLRLPGFSDNPIRLSYSYWNLRRMLRLLWAFVIIAVLVTLIGASPHAHSAERCRAALGLLPEAAGPAGGGCAGRSLKPARPPERPLSSSAVRVPHRPSKLAEGFQPDRDRFHPLLHLHNAHRCAACAVGAPPAPRLQPRGAVARPLSLLQQPLWSSSRGR